MGSFSRAMFDFRGATNIGLVWLKAARAVFLIQARHDQQGAERNDNVRDGVEWVCRIVGIFLIFVAGAFSPCWALDLGKKGEFNIPEGPLGPAIQQFSQQAGIQVVVPGALALDDLHTAGIGGELSVGDALQRLLAGTGLNYKVTGETSIAVAPSTPKQASQASAEASTTQLNGVTVSASKRNENDRKVSSSVTAITGRQLQDIGAESFADYLTTVPGVQFNQETPDQSLISMRGVTLSNSATNVQSPVGTFFDEIPLTDPYSSVLIPDIDTFDVSQVEVLRGPQGALFGSGALGGAINYIPNRADSSDYDARLETTGVVGVNGQLGGSGKGMINIPIARDSFAIRAIGFTRRDPGYIDNIGIGREHSNDSEAMGGRVMADWKIASATTLSFTSLYQRSHLGDMGYETPGLGDLQKSSKVAEFTTGRLNLDDLRLESDLGFAKLVGIAGYQYKYYAYDMDISNAASAALGPALGAELSPVQTPSQYGLHGYTADVRLVSPSSQHFEWLAGAFYADRREGLAQQLQALGLNSVPEPITTLAEQTLGPTLGSEIGPTFAQNDNLLLTNAFTKVTELALYADATYKITDQWKLSAGGRGYHNHVQGEYLQEGFYELLTSGVASSDVPGAENDWGFNPKVSISYSPNEDDLFYMLYSRGFSLGGPNLTPSTATFPIPRSYGPSKLYNYEIGAKTAWLNHHLLVDVTPFYIYWKDAALSLTAPNGLLYQDNVGGAHNSGVETAVTALPIRHLVLTSTITYLKTGLAGAYNPGGGAPVVPAGTPLPGASPWQTSMIATYKWLTYSVPSHLSLVNRYVSRAVSGITDTNIRQGGYDTTSIRGGVQWQGVGAELFVENLADRRGIATTEVYEGEKKFVIQPRTIGINLSWSLQ